MRPAVAAAVLALATGCSDAVPLEQWQGAVEAQLPVLMCANPPFLMCFEEHRLQCEKVTGAKLEYSVTVEPASTWPVVAQAVTIYYNAAATPIRDLEQKRSSSCRENRCGRRRTN